VDRFNSGVTTPGSIRRRAQVLAHKVIAGKATLLVGSEVRLRHQHIQMVAAEAIAELAGGNKQPVKRGLKNFVFI